MVTPRRLDLAVKWRFFNSLLSGQDFDAGRIYRWHIEARSGHRMQAGFATDRWKRTTDDYVASARRLLISMSQGFAYEYAIPIDPNGELLDGSHRVACAVALGFKEIPVTRELRDAWAPAWGFDWFVANDLCGLDLVQVVSDWDLMRA